VIKLSHPKNEVKKVNTDKINEIYERQVDMVYRVCLSYAKNKADTEDCVSETFMKLINSNPDFTDTEHEKAWLIRTAANVCKNHLKHWSRKNVNIDDYKDTIPHYGDIQESVEESELLQAVRNLPDRLKTAVYLYYYEGRNSIEIARILDKPDSTIRGYLMQAKQLLKEKLENHRKEVLT
jgi:RNA polymerase sigma-70 factor (ECF subfamily)